MDSETVARINLTVDAIVLRCLSGPKSPMSTLLDCIDDLIDERTPEGEVELIRSIVERVIRERLVDTNRKPLAGIWPNLDGD
jgi:hypothetical protein